MDEFTVSFLWGLTFAQFLFDELSNRFQVDPFISLSILAAVADERLTSLAIVIGKRRALWFFCLEVRKDRGTLEHSARHVCVATSDLIARPCKHPVI